MLPGYLKISLEHVHGFKLKIYVSVALLIRLQTTAVLAKTSMGNTVIPAKILTPRW